MPLTFGGGIKTIEDVDLRIQNGADKITINTSAFENPQLITKTAIKYGNQCVVISIDYRLIDGQPIVFTHFGQNNTFMNLYDWIKKCEELGAGEIFINAIDRDGKANGYDLDTIKKVCELTRLPVIACGGAGDPYDFVDCANETKVAAIAAGNIFHFTELSYTRSKQLMKKNDINVR